MVNIEFKLSNEKLNEVLTTLEKMASGDTSQRFKISGNRDSLDAICYGINVLVQEMTFSKEEAERANKSKSAFLAMISHEIRTPVTAIKGFSELLDNPYLSDKDRANYIIRINSNCRMLLALIDEILDLSKIEAGKLKAEKQISPLMEILSEVVNNAQLSAYAKGIELRLHLSPSVPEFIETDSMRLNQILTNIVNNAIKYTEKGDVEIFVDLIEERGKNNKLLSVVVEDSGIGMSEEVQRRLFEPFFRGSEFHGPRGTGLGLALSKKLANLLGGDLMIVKSAPNAGSTFKVTVDAGSFPVITAQALAIPTLDRRTQDPFGRKALSGLKILLAEDNEDLQTLFKSIFEIVGATVTVADNGERAITLAFADAFDVILMDVSMPKMDGIEATKKLREKGYKGPIMALSAHAMKEHEAECRLAGYSDFVTKPVDEEVLFSKILALAKPSTPSN